MNQFYLILILLWAVYYVIHSVLAAASVKRYFGEMLGKNFRYYRLAYSVFAAVTLLGVLWYQYSFSTPMLFDSFVIKIVSFFLLVLPGFSIMFISIKKYFFLLSGVRSIYVATPPAELKLTGIHRFVRHPLYSGTILFVWGLFLIFPLVSNLIAVVMLTLYVLAGIVFEEKKLVAEFGDQYKDYMDQVPGLIPRFGKRQ